MFEIFFKEQALQRKTPLMWDEFLEKYQNDVILITGAGGSIGKKIIKKLTEINFKNMVLVDQSELNLFVLKKRYFSNSYKYELADVRDQAKIERIIQTNKPKLVIHAAAYKHVSLVENDAYEYIRTNLEGTINVFKSSLKNLVSDFIFISTDKAINPVNNMGLSKMLSELFLKSYFENEKITIKIIRFGNVINSTGSVIPIFLDNIDNGTDIEIRNENVERYFIYDDVVSKNILNISLDRTSSMYLLEMNSPIKIIDLANFVKRIKKSNVLVKIVSLGEKEKLTEELLNYDESTRASRYLGCKLIESSTVLPVKINEEIVKIVKENQKFNSEKVKKRIEKIKNLLRNN